MEQPGEMNTVSQILEKLRLKGRDNEIKMTDHGKMQSANLNKIYRPEDLTIVKTYRFEGDSNPDDSAVLYVLEDNSGNKGIIIDSYGADSNYPGEAFDKFLRDIPILESDEFNF